MNRRWGRLLSFQVGLIVATLALFSYGDADAACRQVKRSYGRWFSVQRLRLQPRSSRCIQFTLHRSQRLLVQVNRPSRVWLRRGRRLVSKGTLTKLQHFAATPLRSGRYTLWLRGRGSALVYLAFPSWNQMDALNKTREHLAKWPERIKGIPFAHWRYRLLCLNRRRIRLDKGQASWKGWNVSLQSVTYGNLVGHRQLEAVIHLRCRSKTKGLRDELFFFRLRAGLLRGLPHRIRRGGLSDKGIRVLGIENKVLRLERIPRKARKYVWNDSIQWKNGRFLRVRRSRKAVVAPVPRIIAVRRPVPAPAPAKVVTARPVAPRVAAPVRTKVILTRPKAPKLQVAKVKPAKRAKAPVAPVVPVAPIVRKPASRPRPAKVATTTPRKTVATGSIASRWSWKKSRRDWRFWLAVGLLLLALLTLWADGSTAWKRRRRAFLWRSMQEPLFPNPVEEEAGRQQLSVWNLFWDLGADVRALVLLQAFDLLTPAKQRDPERVSELEKLWSTAGSYEWWIEQVLPYLQNLPPIPELGRDASILRNQIVQGFSQTAPFHPDSAFTVVEIPDTVHDHTSDFPATLYDAAVCDLFDLHSNSETMAADIAGAAMRYYRIHKASEHSEPRRVFVTYEEVYLDIPPVVFLALETSMSASSSPEQPNLAEFAAAYHHFMGLCRELAVELMQGSRKHELLLNMNRPFRFWDERRQATQSLSLWRQQMPVLQAEQLKILMKESTLLQQACKQELLVEKKALLEDMNRRMKEGQPAEVGHLLFANALTLLDHLELQHRVEVLEGAWSDVLLEAQQAQDRGWLTKTRFEDDFYQEY